MGDALLDRLFVCGRCVAVCVCVETYMLCTGRGWHLSEEVIMSLVVTGRPLQVV